MNPFGPWIRPGDPAPWSPRADLYRTREGWLLKVDLAGLRPAEVEVTLRGSRLVISGSRRDRTIRRGWEVHQMEIAYSRFERTFELPEPSGTFSCTSRYREGMLLIELNREGRREEA